VIIAQAMPNRWQSTLTIAGSGLDCAMPFHIPTPSKTRTSFCRAQSPVFQKRIFVLSAAVGGIGLRPGEDVHRHTAEFGYWLAEEFWGRGIMSQVVPAFVDYCFKEFSLNRLFAMPHSNNSASARVLEKAGFVLEGRLRNNVVKDGKILDSLLYARTS
jgi:RimJ/RimL family protein N-acetyltransferase